MGMIDPQKVVRLYRQGKTGPEIAQELGCSFARVYQILADAEVPRRRHKQPAKKLIKIRPERVVDKILRYLREHPLSTVTEIAAGIGHENQGTVGQILSRLKRQGDAVVDERQHASEPYLWSLAKTLENRV